MGTEYKPQIHKCNACFSGRHNRCLPRIAYAEKGILNAVEAKARCSCPCVTCEHKAISFNGEGKLGQANAVYACENCQLHFYILISD